MKTLYLLRHAKSSWGTPELPDHERPLNGRGRRAASAMGRYLWNLPSHPELVLASTARRVAETLELLLAEMAGDMAVIRDRSLYLATPKRLLYHLHTVSENPDSIMIIGHNPGLHEFALKLASEVANEAAYEARARMKDAYPTTALAVIRFPEAQFWNEITFGQGSLVSFTTPRDLES
jgi:phosphohistidine phosphatase